MIKVQYVNLIDICPTKAQKLPKFIENNKRYF